MIQQSSRLAWIAALGVLVLSGTPPARAQGLSQSYEEATKLLDTGDFDKALTVLTRMATLAENARTSKTDWQLLVKWKTAGCHYRLGDFFKAEAILKEIIDKAPDDYDFYRFVARRDLGEFYLEQRELAAAKDYLKAANDSRNELFHRGRNPERFPRQEKLRIQFLYGKWLTAVGEADEARKLLKHLERQFEDGPKSKPEEDEEPKLWWYHLAQCRLQLAELERRTSNAAAAAEQLKRLIGDVKAQDSHLARNLEFTCRNNLAMHYWNLTRFDDAAVELAASDGAAIAKSNRLLEGDLKEAWTSLWVEKATFVLETDFNAETLTKLLDSAEKAARRAVVCAQMNPEPNVKHAHRLFLLAQVQELQGRVLEATGKPSRTAYEQAEKSYDESLRLHTKIGWKMKHDMVIAVHRCRARLLARLNRLDEARAEVRSALKDYVQCPGHSEKDPGCADFYRVLVDIEARAGNLKESVKYGWKHRKLAAELLVQYLPRLTAPEQIRFFRMWDDPGLYASLRVATSQAEKFADDSAEWLINGKAKIAEVFAQANLQAREHAELQKIIQNQASLHYGWPKAPATQLEAAIRSRELEKRRLTAAMNTDAKSNWIKLNDLKEALHKDETFVDVFCVRAEGVGPRTYHAWVVTADGARVVTLGDATEIEKLIRVFHEHQKVEGMPDPPLVRLGPDRAEPELHSECLNRLSQLLLEPILKAADGKKRWTVSPDGPLWSIPWGALLLPGDKKYAVEQLTIGYAISGRDLVRLRKHAGGARGVGAWVLTDANYDMIPEKNGWQRGVLGFRRLGYDAEASEFLRDVVELGPNTTKDALLQRTRKGPPPRILHLHTHGFFVEDRLPADDPLFCCAIVLAGGNYVPVGGPTKDASLPGLMTGAEVLSLNLQGTELVILGACQTGVGKMDYGQSPADLRHAFHMAGAQAVVSSLWSVREGPTKDLMRAFTKNLAGGMAKAEALKKAQCDMIDSLRASPDRHSHPFYWAAFTISGE